MRIKFSPLPLIAALLILSGLIYAQDTTHSLAFKKERPVKRNIFYQPDLAYKIWQQYELSREANNGDPRAQHELGLRYLLGDDMPADTVKGAYWIKKAADQNYTPALFNYGILLFNGWGVRWNPYKAFDLFTRAAIENMPQAQLLLGLLYTDDLVTPKNLAEAYKWVKKSAANNYEPAKEYLEKLERRVPTSVKDTSDKHIPASDLKKKNPNTQSVNSGLVYIDFDTNVDSVSEVTYEDLLEDILNSNNKSLATAVKKNRDSVYYFDESMLDTLNESARYGSAEAITLEGWFYQNGINYGKNLIKALSFYTRGASLESRRSMILLWQLINKKGTMAALKDSSDGGDALASITWYQLYKMKLDRRMVPQDAINLLNKALVKNNNLALVEAGLNFYSGFLVEQDRIKGISLWQRAADAGNIEARIRIETSKLLGETPADDLNESLQYIIEASNKGSVLAEAALANFYYKNNDLSKAVYYLRSAAMRGSSYAYNKLKSIYEEIKTRNN